MWLALSGLVQVAKVIVSFETSLRHFKDNGLAIRLVIKVTLTPIANAGFVVCTCINNYYIDYIILNLYLHGWDVGFNLPWNEPFCSKKDLLFKPKD